MHYIPSVFDFALASVAAILMAIEVLLFGLVMRRHSGFMRTGVYAFFIVYQWTLVGCIVALWAATGRSWAALLLGRPNPWGFAIGLALAVAYVWLALRQHGSLLDRPEIFEKLRGKHIAPVEPLLPHTAAERRLSMLVAVTAGVCEEVVFRGFLITFIASFTGLIAAAAIQIVLFGLFHAYYGIGGILKTGTFGLVATVIALASGSLVPVIVIHIAADAIPFDLGYRVLSAPEQTSTTA